MRLKDWMLVTLCVWLVVPAGCIEIQQLAASMGNRPDDANDNTNVNANDDSVDPNDNTAEPNDNSNEPDNSVGPTPPPDDSSNDDANSNANDNTNANDNSDDTGIPPLPDDAVLTTTETGLQYYDFEIGDGATPDVSNSVIVRYTGYLPNGEIFDSNPNAQLALTRVVPGFSEGILGMKVGGERRLYIPPALGYGENGNARAGIGGEDTIVFDVLLKGITGLPNLGVAQ